MSTPSNNETQLSDSGTKLETKTIKPVLPQCGIVMPISATENYSANHWKDVLDIIKESVSMAGFAGELVSYADESGIIQKNIIQNLYNNPIAIVDVSGKNPNVMFELGLRLAFDKPTIIVKDELTDYVFDTGIIEHLPYPKTLHYQTIVEFKQKLKEKIIATHSKATTDKEYSTFLKQFGQFKVAELPSKEVTLDKFVLQKLNDIEKQIQLFKADTGQRPAQGRVVSAVETGELKTIIINTFNDHKIVDPDNNTKNTFVPIVKEKIRNVLGLGVSDSYIKKLMDDIYNDLPF